MGSETPKWQPTPDQILEGKFGEAPIREAERISRSIFEQIKAGIIDIGMQEGTSQEQQEKVKQCLEMWHEFSRGLFARTSSVNAKSLETVETVIRGANSLLSVKPTNENNEAAQKMVEALNQRY
jgi:hypothetical protein